ncbi:hypothetical protein RQP46_009466 [Phenoliferia psychrophenolica]
MPGDSGDDEPAIVPMASGSDVPVKAVRVDCIFLDSRRGRPRTKPLRPSAVPTQAVAKPEAAHADAHADMVVDVNHDIPVNGFSDVYGSEVDLAMSPATSLQHFFSTAVPSESDVDGVGIASRTYFDEVQSPTTSFVAFVEKAPIMKLITLKDVETLFSVFLLRLHALVPILHAFAKKELAKFPTEKSLEAVQAEILYTGFGLTPSATYQQDTVWLRVGMATRMALDISLHLAGTPAYKHTVNPTEPWRLASMKRTWLLCCSLDKMLSCQKGKPSIILDIPEEGFSTEDETTTPDDRRVYANVEMAQIITRGMEASRKYSKESPSHDGCLSDAIAQMEADLEQWWETWNMRIMIGLSGSGASGQAQIRHARLKLYHSHAKLMSASITLQHALDIEASDPTLKPFALAKYQGAAIAILQTFRDDFVAHGHAEYLTDYQYGYLLSAAIALLKSLQPQFKHSLISVLGAGKLIESTAVAFENCAADQLHSSVTDGWDSSLSVLNYSRQGSPFNTSPMDYTGASWATEGWENLLDVGMFDPQAIFQPGVFDNL